MNTVRESNLAKYRYLMYALIICAMAAFAFVRYIRTAPEKPIAPQGGEALELKLAVPVYLQHDERWSTEHLGNSNSRIGPYGCTLCSLSMSLQSQGYDCFPNKLNEALSANRGYTQNGLLIWGQIETSTSLDLDILISNAPTHSVIDNSIKNNIPVIIKIYLDSGLAHWVLITGKSALEYLIHDPLGVKAGYEPLSKYNSDIHAIRIVKINKSSP